MRKHWLKPVAVTLLLTVGAMSLPARAEVISTSSALALEDNSGKLASERADIRRFLARADVQAQLTGMGVNPDEARQRVAALTDQEVEQVHGKLQQLPAGGDIIGAIVFVFLVLLITDILGLTKVFPFTRPIRR